MADFPSHWCDRDDGYKVIMPVSVLDCDQAGCRTLAEWAVRAAGYDPGYVESSIVQARETIASSQKRLERWELVREAQLRVSGEGLG